MLDILRVVIGCILMLIGLITIILAIAGVYRLNYILNRMHVAATCDTLGIFFMLLGLVFIEGVSFTTFKLVCIIVFFWISSPVCSHLISRVESETNENIKEECEEVRI